MLEKDPKTRRDRVDWYPWMVRYEAGECQKVLAAEAGCDRQTIYRAWKWFSALTPSERAGLRQAAFRRLTAKIESDALRGEIDQACKDARGLETVRRLLDAVEDDMTKHNERPGAVTHHDDGIADPHAELLRRINLAAGRREQKALGLRSDGGGCAGEVSRVAGPVECKRGPDTP